MKASELDLRELLELNPEGGIIHFAGERVLLLDAVALGLLRRELISTLGVAAAKGLLTRFGFSHGWRTAEALEQGKFSWDDPGEWRRAGGRLHTLQGLVRSEGLPGQRDGPFGAGILHDSYEAEQHLLHLGQAEQPVCWTLTGFASGYMSRCHGESVYFVETRCVGKGDPVCEIEGRPREAWAVELQESELAFYESPCLSAALGQVTKKLKRAERLLQARRRRLSRLADDFQEPEDIVASSPEMQRVVELARRAGRVDTTVLVTGESGVGKERVARLLHESSPRGRRAFLAINCGAISESLMESELFGHARGAFSGASQERVGLFEAAQGGTLFLDEVGELALDSQVKLLRVLQERRIRRVGDNLSRPIDVRLVAATNRDLAAEVRAGRFRRDLYYRLKVIELEIAPLRERRADILPLARRELLALALKHRMKVTGLTPAAADQLLRYSWPGNVRELHNAIERAIVVTGESRIGLADLPEEVRQAQSPEAAPNTSLSLAEAERRHILAVLEAQGGHRGRSAALLGIGPATLYRKLKRYAEEQSQPSS